MGYPWALFHGLISITHACVQSWYIYEGVYFMKVFHHCNVGGQNGENMDKFILHDTLCGMQEFGIEPYQTSTECPFQGLSIVWKSVSPE